ncbi:MAG: DUF192 domain-containing protein [Actinomycetes bacterium]
MEMLDRLRQLPVLPHDALEPSCKLRVHVANSHIARLRGLAGRRVQPAPGFGLLLTQTGAVHTWGMAFPIDLIWLSKAGVVIRIDREVAAHRHVFCRGARALIETPYNPAHPVELKEGHRLTAQMRTLRRLPPPLGWGNTKTDNKETLTWERSSASQAQEPSQQD